MYSLRYVVQGQQEHGERYDENTAGIFVMEPLGMIQDNPWYQMGQENWSDLRKLKELLAECETQDERQALLKGVISRHEED